MAGDTKCSFCGREEDIEHLFVHCSVAKMSWMVMKCSFDIHDVPDKTNDIFGRWLNKFEKNDKNLLTIGISAMLWTMWKLRNRLVFDNHRVIDPCVPVNLIIKNLHEWCVLQKNQGRIICMKEGVKQFEHVAREIFKATHGWMAGAPRLEGS